jgi:hypothetical protein
MEIEVEVLAREKVPDQVSSFSMKRDLKKWFKLSRASIERLISRELRPFARQIGVAIPF